MNRFHYMKESKKLVPKKPGGKTQIKYLHMEREFFLFVFINKARKQLILDFVTQWKCESESVN